MPDAASTFNRLRKVLQGSYFFQSLKPGELDELISRLRMVRVQKGYEIVKQGDPGDSFYLIAAGQVSVWAKKGSSKAKVADLGPDEFFGERALLTNETRNATVLSEEVVELFILQKYDFDKLLTKNPVMVEELQKAFQEHGKKNQFDV